MLHYCNECTVCQGLSYAGTERLPCVQLQAIGTVPSNTASPASNHPRPDAPVPVLVAGDYSTRVQVMYIRKYVTAEECAINSGIARGQGDKRPRAPRLGAPK